MLSTSRNSHSGKRIAKGDAWEATARTEVEDVRARLEADHLGNAERVEYMVLIECIDILAGDDVDLRFQSR